MCRELLWLVLWLRLKDTIEEEWAIEYAEGGTRISDKYIIKLSLFVSLVGGLGDGLCEAS